MIHLMQNKWKIRLQLTKPVTWPPLVWGVVCGAAASGKILTPCRIHVSCLESALKNFHAIVSLRFKGLITSIDNRASISRKIPCKKLVYYVIPRFILVNWVSSAVLQVRTTFIGLILF